MLVACLRVVSLRCQFFSDIFTKQPHPPARVNLWVGGGGCRLVLDCVENCGQAWRGFMRRDLPQDICFQLTSRLRVVLPRNFNITWWEFWYETEEVKKWLTYNRKGITRKVCRKLSVALGQRMNWKYWSRARIWYDTRYAQDGRQRRYGVSQSWRWRYFWGVYFRFRPCVNRKIVATRKCSWHVCASCHYDVSSFPTYLQSNRTPCPRKSLGWEVVAGSCWIVLKTAVKRDAVLCGATCRKIFVFQLTSQLRVVLPRNF